LITSCTLDWFTEWPEEALVGVGKGQLADFIDTVDISPEKLVSLVEMFKIMHKSVEKISVKYAAELRRYNYVTPTSYLELLSMYKIVMKEKKTEV
jgi:dynein heavy chain